MRNEEKVEELRRRQSRGSATLEMQLSMEATSKMARVFLNDLSQTKKERMTIEIAISQTWGVRNDPLEVIDHVINLSRAICIERITFISLVYQVVQIIKNLELEEYLGYFHEKQKFLQGRYRDCIFHCVHPIKSVRYMNVLRMSALSSFHSMIKIPLYSSDRKLKLGTSNHSHNSQVDSLIIRSESIK